MQRVVEMKDIFREIEEELFVDKLYFDDRRLNEDEIDDWEFETMKKADEIEDWDFVHLSETGKAK